jgi:nucleoid DNA-binding protein
LAKRVKLFAWAVPVRGARRFADHTWVTSYDNRTKPLAGIKQVIAAKEHFWYCWGEFHRNGGTPHNRTGFLGDSHADLAQAQCLVQPNAESQKVQNACGTIYMYARDGVCHQLANQALYATGVDGRMPLKVQDAYGYWASNFAYGTYGLNHAAWQRKIDSCGARRESESHSDDTPMTQKPDDFETRARNVLGARSTDLLPKLLALRAGAQSLTLNQWRGSRTPTAKELNQNNQKMFDRAAELLGREDFERIFGFSPNERIDLVDQRFLQQHQQTHQRTVSPKKDATTATVTLKQLAASLAEDSDISKKQAEAILGGLVGNIVQHLKKGQRIRIGGLGILQVRKRAARMGRNPSTGERLQIKASKKVDFRASKDLKEAI